MMKSQILAMNLAKSNYVSKDALEVHYDAKRQISLSKDNSSLWQIDNTGCFASRGPRSRTKETYPTLDSSGRAVDLRNLFDTDDFSD